KKKRKRVAKDPNAPKKPVTGYLLYQEEQKRELKGKEDTPAYKEMLKLIGAKWKELTDAEKQPYEEAHKAAVAQYEIEKAAYDQ
ncbi:HMG-box, partial [Clavulina sp. PMI_390]